jgi:mannose-6-phosphate isomerase-like protein (cupin superfamily)
MKGFVEDIEEAALENDDFRQVLYTGPNLQLVLMSLAPGEDIGEEIHMTGDQFFRVEKGKGEVSIDGHKTRIHRNDAFVVPSGARHNVINTGQKPMKLYTVYGPPQHRDQFNAKTKAEAEAAKEKFAGEDHRIVMTAEPPALSAPQQVWR